MDLSSITNWLRTSLLGVIVLGALGSLLAILLLGLGKFLLVRCHVGVRAWKKREYDLGWKTGAVLGYLDVRKDPTLAAYFTAYLLARFILAVFASLILFMVFYSLVPTSGPALRPTTFVLATLFFVSLRWLYEEYRDIRSLYKHEIYPILKTSFESRESKQETDQPVRESDAK